MKNIIIYLVGALLIGVLMLLVFPKLDSTIFGVVTGGIVFIYSYFFRRWEEKANNQK